MADAVSALGGASYAGYARIEEIGPVGMITLRGQPADLATATQAAIGIALPSPRRIETKGEVSIGWMSPDEYLLILPYTKVRDTLATLHTAMAGQHFLAVDVSDARAVFRISGPQSREVLAKITPVDLSPAAFHPGEMRRTRAAQVAAAFWMGEDQVITLVSFRSVAAYVFALLQTSAMPGAEVGLF